MDEECLKGTAFLACLEDRFVVSLNGEEGDSEDANDFRSQ